MSNINTIHAREIIDSRGLPTLECLIWLDDGRWISTSVPSGVSKTDKGVVELIDHDQNRMVGKGVLQSVDIINNQIGPQLIGQNPINQQVLDQYLIDIDGTEKKEKFGSNTLLVLSQAIAKAGALAAGMPLYKYIQQAYQLTPAPSIPSCIYGLINGGRHGADNLDIQEFEIIPASHIDYPDSLSMAVTMFHQLDKVLQTKGAIRSRGLVGGFAPNLYNNTDALDILIETIKTTTFTFAQDLFFGVDVEASTLYSSGKYNLKDKKGSYSSSELLDYYKLLRQQYHVFYLEDPFAENDWKSWQKILAEMKDTTIIAADTLTNTNKKTIKKAIAEKTSNAMVLKINQAGTVTEAIEAAHIARQADWKIVVSHRTRETCDTFIADFAAGISADYAKFGPPNQGERVSKYNRLLQIDQQLKRSSA